MNNPNNLRMMLRDALDNLWSRVLSLFGGLDQRVKTIEDSGYADNTTYTLSQDAQDGHILTLTGSDGSSVSVTVPDNDTTYSPATESADGLMSAGDKVRLNHAYEAETVGPAGVVSLADGIKDMPVKDLTVAIEPVQAGSGDPSPENVRPISGWSGVNVYVSPTQDARDATIYAVTFPADPGTVYGGTLDVLSGALTVDRLGRVFDGTENWTYVSSSFYRFVDSRGICNNSVNRACSHFANANVSGDADPVQEDAPGEDFRIVTQPVDCVMPIGEMAWFKVVATGVVGYQWQYHNGTRWKDYDVETAHDATFHIETLTRRYGYLYRCKLTGENDEALYTDTVRIIEPTGYYAYTSPETSDTRIQIWPEIESVTDLAAWKSWLAEQSVAGTPVTCWWEIAEPIAYQLTPAQVELLAGANHIWADAGDVTVTYGAYIEMLFEQIAAQGAT